MIIVEKNGKQYRHITFVKECDVLIPIEQSSDEEVDEIIKGIVESEEPGCLDFAWKDKDEQAVLYGELHE